MPMRPSFLWVLPFVLGHYSGLKAETYSTDTCLFEVTFPAKPERYITSNHIGDFDAAQLTVNGSFLRAECFPNMYNSNVSQIALSKQVLLDYAAGNGLSQPSVTIYEHEDYFASQLRGYKNIDGKKAIYEMVTYWSESSVLFVLVASAAEIFPTREIFDFISTVRMAPAKN